MDPSVPWPYAYNRLAQGSATGELHHFAQAANVNNSSLSNSHNTASNGVSTTSSPLLLQASTASFNASSFMPATGGYESVFSPIFQPKPAHFNPISAQHRHQVLAAQAAQAAQAAVSKLTADSDVIRDNYALHHTSLATAAAAQSGSNYFDQTNGSAVNAAASVVAALGWQGNNQLSNSFGMLPHENVPASACSSSSTAKNSTAAVSANPSAYEQFNTHFNSQLNQSNSIIKNPLSQQLPTHQHQQTQQTPLKSLPSPSTSSSMYYQTPATSTYNTPPTNQPLQQTHHQQSFNGSKSSLTDIGNGSSLSKSIATSHAHAEAVQNGVKTAIKIEPSPSSYSPQPKAVSPAYRRSQNVSFSENGRVNYSHAPSMSPQYSRNFPANFPAETSASKGAAARTEQFANAQSASRDFHSRSASTDACPSRSLPPGSGPANSFYGNLMPAQAQCSPAVVNQGRHAQHSLDTLRSSGAANDISQSVIRVPSFKGYTPSAQVQCSADVSQKSPDQTRNYTLAQLNSENNSNHCDSKASLADAKLKSFQKIESEREAEERKFPLSLHNSNFLSSNDNLRFQNYPNHALYHHPHPYFSSLYGAQSPVAGFIDHTAGSGASMVPLALAAPYSDSLGTPSVSSNYSTTPEIMRDDEPPPKVLVPNIEEELEFLTENSRSGNAVQQLPNMQTAIHGSSGANQQAKPAAIKTVADTKKFNTPTGPGSGFMQSYLKFLQGERDSSPPPINRNVRKQFPATPANEQAKFNGQKRSASIDDDDYSDKGKQTKGTNKKSPRNVVDRAPQIPINTQKRSKMNDSMYDSQAMGPQLTQLQTPLQQAHQLNPVPLQSQMLQQQSMYYQQPDEGAFHYYDFHSRRQKW